MVICWWTLFHCCPCLLVVLVVHGQLLLPGCWLIVGFDKRGSVTGCERLLLAVPTWLLRPVTRRNFSCNLQRNMFKIHVPSTDLNYWIKHPFEFSDPILKPEYL